MNNKSNSERHRDTIPHVKRAIDALRSAVIEQDGLEFGHSLEGVAMDLNEMLARIARYQAEAKAGIR